MTGTVTEVVSQMSKEERTSRKEARIARRELRKANKAARKEEKELRKAKEEEKNRLNDAIEEGWEEDTKWRNNRRDLFNDTIAEMRNGETLETKNKQGDTDLGRKIRYMARGTGRKTIPGTEELSDVTIEYFQTSERGTDMQEAKWVNLKTNFVEDSTSRIYTEVNNSRWWDQKEKRDSFFYDKNWFDGKRSRFDQITDDAMSRFDARMASKLFKIHFNDRRLDALKTKKRKELSYGSESKSFEWWQGELSRNPWKRDVFVTGAKKKVMENIKMEIDSLTSENKAKQNEVDIYNILGRQHFKDDVVNCINDINLANLTTSEWHNSKEWQGLVTACQKQPIEEMAKIVNDVNLEFCQSNMDSDFSEVQVDLDSLGITVEEVTRICDLYIYPVV